MRDCWYDSSYEGRFRRDVIDGQGTLRLDQCVMDGGNEDYEWIIPINNCGSDLGRIHLKAGFTPNGE